MSRHPNSMVQGALEALAFASAEANVDDYVVTIPEAIDVKAIRRTFGLSQARFADTFGLTVARIRDWEQGRYQPDSAARAYLTIIQRDPEAVKRALGESTVVHGQTRPSGPS